MDHFGLSDFYNPFVAELYFVVFDVTLVLSTAQLPLVLYLILFQSKRLGKYRWYMLNNALWGYSYDAVLAVAKPIMLFPLLGGYCNSPFRLSTEAAFVLVKVVILTAVNRNLGACLAVVYRFAQVGPHDYEGELRVQT